MGHSTLVATTKAGRPASSRVIDTLLGFERKVATDEEATARQITTTVGDGHVNATTAGGQKRPSVPKLELTTALQPQPPSSAAPVSNSPRKMVSMRLEGDEAWVAQGPKSLNRWASLLSTVLPDGGETGVDAQQRRAQQAAAVSLPSPCNLLDRQTFRTLGIPDVIVSRVYKLLEAYVVGFNGLVRDILSGQPEGGSPELVAVVWQSLLGMAEEHFKAGYRSEMGAITQRLVEQQSDLHGQLQQAEKTIAAMEGQNGVMQSAMHLVRSELQQEVPPSRPCPSCRSRFCCPD